MAVALADAASNVHPTVPGVLYDDDAVGGRTCSVERLPVTVLPRLWKTASIRYYRRCPALLCRKTASMRYYRRCPARFTSSLKLLFSPGPGLGAPLSSYLEGALYKFHR